MSERIYEELAKTVSAPKAHDEPAAPGHPVLRLQRQLGNRYVDRLLSHCEAPAELGSASNGVARVLGESVRRGLDSTTAADRSLRGMQAAAGLEHAEAVSARFGLAPDMAAQRLLEHGRDSAGGSSSQLGSDAGKQRGTAAAVGAAGGAALGGIIGAFAGGPLGALIGAGIGALFGAVIGAVLATKVVTVNVSVLSGASDTSSADFTTANQVYAPAATRITAGTRETVSPSDSAAILGGDGILEEFAGPAITAEEALLTARNRSGGRISAYWVPALSAGSRGEAITPGYHGVADPSVVISSSARASDTFAHELGHILTNESGHSADPDNLMASGAIRNVGVDKLEQGQIDAIRASRYAS